MPKLIRRIPGPPRSLRSPSRNWPWSAAGALYVSVNGRMMDLVSRALSTTDTTVPRPAVNGMAADFDGSSGEQVAFPSNSFNGPTGALTLLVHFEVDALSNYGGLIAKQGTTTTNMPYELRIGLAATTSEINFVRAHGTGYRSYNASTNRLTAGRKNQFVAVTCANGLIETIPTIYWLDGFGSGVFSSYVPGGAAGGAGTGNVTDTTNPVILGNRSDSTVVRLDGLIYTAAVLPVALSDEQVQAAFFDMLAWRHVEPEPILLFVPAAAPAGSTITTAILPAGVGHMGSGQTRAIQPAGLSYMG